jgi:hypothetical protein
MIRRESTQTILGLFLACILPVMLPLQAQSESPTTLAKNSNASDTGACDLVRDIVKVRNQSLLFGGPGIETCFSFAPGYFREQPSNSPPECAVREVIRRETADGCLLLGVCGSPADGMHFISILGWASCRTPPKPIIGDWHAELRYPQPSDTLAGIGIVYRKEDVTESHFDETLINSKIAVDSNPWRELARSETGEVPGAFVDLMRIIRETCACSILFGGPGDDLECSVGVGSDAGLQGNIVLRETPVRVIPLPAIGDWHAELRYPQPDEYSSRGRFRLGRHRPQLGVPHFDETTDSANGTINKYHENGASPFQSIANLMYEIEEPSYQFDGLGTEDRPETRITVFMSSPH